MFISDTNRRIYLDMDGVLVKYNRDAYTGTTPLYLQKNMHYFRDLEPDRRMLAVADKINDYCSDRYVSDELYVMTSVSAASPMFNEHFHDKIIWLSKWMPYIDVDHIIISVTNKRDAAEYINGRSLTENDILIDDYNKNLKDWNAAGGCSIKYCNGINDPYSFKAPERAYRTFEDYSANKIIHAINQYCRTRIADLNGAVSETI